MRTDRLMVGVLVAVMWTICHEHELAGNFLHERLRQLALDMQVARLQERIRDPRFHRELEKSWPLKAGLQDQATNHKSAAVVNSHGGERFRHRRCSHPYHAVAAWSELTTPSR